MATPTPGFVAWLLWSRITRASLRNYKGGAFAALLPPFIIGSELEGQCGGASQTSGIRRTPAVLAAGATVV